ncbi:D-alanyl-D-alanine carboxypeptidase family protein [Desulfopila aestuarii]|uniref:D-alanyl-D-alanine carboxypeptidase (Penicillin-binding protein 5/6) n=1 Tax=Desulfopila aestuarii DSM 18488 TaxID=1121416 RepID=A0A1M7XXS1_9BACT|nr:D-alanyl-D-alanine carboxypeptidase family protein [Desulfopila aestuarii]SHO43634.1 D-alanyl-D-alanine carboxypeptidase (penicillin-binding protein 5/6) [Desulfopila aestuarii DSM 18488]
MKRIVVLIVVLLIAGQNSWAARAKVDSISRDPYVSALVLDANSGKVLFSENPDSVVYPASVVKLMDLLIVLERIERGENRLDEMVQVTVEAAKTGGSQVYLDPKEQFSIEDLLYALAVQSANDAAVALAVHIGGSKDGFVALMNQKAAELGMKNTRFYSVHGLPPSEGQKTDQTTANDLALLCRALVSRPDVLQYTSTRERGFRENKFIMRNHNHLLGQVDGCDGLKTGYFEAAGFSIAATAKRGGNRVIAIVMGSKDRKVRDAKTAELLGKGFALLPPKPEPVQVVTAPAPESPAETAVAETASVSQPAVPIQEEEVADSSEGFGWGTFFLGMMAGILLSGCVAFFSMGRRPVRGLR